MNFKIKSGDDGTWFIFTASDKTEAMINVENMAEKFTSKVVQKTILKWCEDRRIIPTKPEGEK